MKPKAHSHVREARHCTLAIMNMFKSLHTLRSYFSKIHVSLLSIKRKVSLTRSRFCPPVCVPLTTFEPVSSLWNLTRRSCHWRWPRRRTFNPVASTIPKWRTFKILRWMQNLHKSIWDHQVLYPKRSSKHEELSITQFLRKPKNTNMKGGWKLKFVELFFHGDNLWTVARRQVWYRKRSWTYLQVLFEPLFCFTELLHMATVQNFEVMLDTVLNQSVEFWYLIF
jgi:hypothetical protein